DLRDVAEAEHASADRKVDIKDILLASERARYANRQRLVAGLDRTGRLDDILRLQCRNKRRAVDSQAGEFLHREFDKDLLVLGAENFNLRYVGHIQELRAHILDVVAKLAMVEAIRRKAVDDPERIAELVVEGRADDARRQSMTDISDEIGRAHVLTPVTDQYPMPYSS